MDKRYSKNWWQESKTNKINEDGKPNYQTPLTKLVEALEVVLNIENSDDNRNREWNEHMEEVTKQINKVESKWERKIENTRKRKQDANTIQAFLWREMATTVVDLGAMSSYAQQTIQTTHNNNQKKIM